MSESLALGYIDKSGPYEHGRPRYPEQAVRFIRQQLHVPHGFSVVDVGSGTGILTRQLAAAGLPMIGIEPDAQMLAQAKVLSAAGNIEYLSGSAEQLELLSNSVAALVCGQSFHWFDAQKAAAEFRRVLACDNPVVLIWNIRSPDHDVFHRAYEELLNGLFEHYERTLRIDNALDAGIESFYAGLYEERIFDMAQPLDESALLARTLSCSYAPQPGTHGYRSAVDALKALHRQYQHQGKVVLKYTTRVVYGRI